MEDLIVTTKSKQKIWGKETGITLISSALDKF
jgi:hypothetical protein